MTALSSHTTGGAEEMSPRSPVAFPGSTCCFVSPWGRCRQPAGDTELCLFHERHRDNEPDKYLHRKIVLGLMQPVDTYLNAVQIRTTMFGRFRMDGRPSDAYALPDQVEGFDAA